MAPPESAYTQETTLARDPMSKSLFFLIVFAIFSVVFGQLFFYQLDGYETVDLIGRSISTNQIFSDFLLTTGLVILLVNGRVVYRLVGYLVSVVFISIYAVQYASLYLTGDYLSPTAIDNIQHIGLILTPSKTAIISVSAVLLLVMVFVAERLFKTSGWNKVILLSVCCFIFAASLKTDEYWLSSDILSVRVNLYQSGENEGRYTSPIRAFANSLGRTWQSVQKSRPLTAAELERLRDFGFVYDEKSDYPLIKDEIYQSELPFQSSGKQADPDLPLNVIVFLSEGISARVVQPYNRQYPGLTPNIASFAGSAMRVDNYYNHTFATYRGLLGQLCSIFPIYAGGQINPQTDYYCLGNLFNEEGYETYFSFSQQKQKTKLDEVLEKTNISHIYAQDDLRRLFLANEPEKRPLALSDQQFFTAIIEHLGALEQRQETGDGKPFFMGLYNIETHAYYQMSDDGVKYKKRDNYILNTIHNYDNAFGRFWQYFKQSALFENTVVIFTADHTHFQGKDFVALVNDQPDYKPNFVDRIPMLIYHPGLELPTDFDAKYASSLDLAPTVAHLMKFKNRPNSFLGRSIFERATNEGLAYGEGHIYLIGSDGVKIQGEYYARPFNDTDINQMYKVINNTHALESQGRIWNRDKN